MARLTSSTPRSASRRAWDSTPARCAIVAVLQNDLFTVGSALADPSIEGPFHNVVGEAHVTRLEEWIDTLECELTPLTQFIIPGGTAASAQLHLARTICRRGERNVVRLGHQPGEHVPAHLLIYLNRLSDLLFVLARVVNRRAGVADSLWGGL